MDSYLIVGLGNPGDRYSRTRHNAGFMVVESFARSLDLSLRRRRHEALTAEISAWGRRLTLALPQTFMNRSGEAVAPLWRGIGAPLSHLVVVHDDLDLPLGRIKLRTGGGAGGHRGVASVAEEISEPGFVRLKAGIGRPADRKPATVYVLEDFTAGEWDRFSPVIDRCTTALEEIVRAGPARAMTRINAAAFQDTEEGKEPSSPEAR